MHSSKSFEVSKFKKSLIIRKLVRQQQPQKRMNRAIDFQSLRMENFQLKNEITDLKNGFDLNKDVLKILSEQIRQHHPKLQIFYQIISRLTGINNQIMVSNIELIQDKNKLMSENKKLQNTIDSLSEKLQQLIKSRDCVNPKQIQMEMRNQMKELRSQILSLNEDCMRKKMEIVRLENTIKQMQNQQLKKPIIASVKDYEKKIKNQISQVEQIPKNFSSEGIIRQKTIKKNLQRQNSHLKRLVQELQYRLTLLSSLYQHEPPRSSRERDYEMREQQQYNYKKISQQQLNLLMFALNNTQLEQDQQNEGIKLTITKRCKNILKNTNQQKIKRVVSSYF